MHKGDEGIIRSSYVTAVKSMRIADRRRTRKTKALVALAALCSCFIFFHMSLSSSIRYLTWNYFQQTLELTRRTSKVNEQFGLRRKENPITCDRTFKYYDICSINGPTVMDPTSSTFFTMGPAQLQPVVETIRPYPRKFENFVMGHIKKFTLISGPNSPPCVVHHNSPALVFAAGGYAGNFWHAFNDGFIPLFITINTLLPEQDFVLVVSDAQKWWVLKYADLLSIFTKHPIITIESVTTTHCFPAAKLGLITHGFMTVNQTLMPNSKTFLHFRELLHNAYNRRSSSSRLSLNHMARHDQTRPRLVLASRGHATGRRITNEAQVVSLMKKVGFDVIVFEPKVTTSMHDSYALLNSSHAFVGVHGAALTHSLFLRPGSVFVQVVPIGIGWAAEACFGRVAKGLELEYYEYKIGEKESSLVDKYGNDSVVVKDPIGLQKMGWSSEVMNKYLKEQNVKLDLVRFKGYLEQAYIKAKKFMENYG